MAFTFGVKHGLQQEQVDLLVEQLNLRMEEEIQRKFEIRQQLKEQVKREISEEAGRHKDFLGNSFYHNKSSYFQASSIHDSHACSTYRGNTKVYDRLYNIAVQKQKKNALQSTKSKSSI